MKRFGAGRGSTLLELLVVVTVIAVLASLLLPVASSGWGPFSAGKGVFVAKACRIVAVGAVILCEHDRE
jgi:prepilin-type N-terminal cleavage/methylation domain-containing protein